MITAKPEVMSPAGHWPQLHAAINAGADSVYFGLNHFTARAKVGFTLDELPEAIRTLHRRGVKGYVTFNTLVFDHELPDAARALAAIAHAGADAVIVQDIGVTRLIREVAPGLEIHGSTQMTITSAEGVELARELGVTRVVLARELSLADIRDIRAHTTMELEMFVHGALCVSYSGQCFSSEAWGGRSANRGQCAQACRLPYEMEVDGRVRPLADARYLLSPGDLYTLREIPEIVRAGVSSLKIEGRYKDADYVALTTAAYRKAVDDAWAGRSDGPSKIEERRLEQVYSRGLGPYFVTGTNHQAVVRGRAPRHRGVLMGRVVRVGATGVWLDSEGTKAGDGVVFDAADWRSPQEPEEGGRVYEAIRGELRFANGAVNFGRIRTGDLVWRTHDPDLDKAVRALEPHRMAVDVDVRAADGEAIVVVWTARNASVTVQSDQPLGTAASRRLDEQTLREQFGRLGNTPYALERLSATIIGNPFAPVSLLNQLRRDAVELLQRAQTGRPTSAVNDPDEAVRAVTRAAVRVTAATPQLHLLLRFPDQLDAAMELRPASITLDYLDLYGLKPSVERVRSAGIVARVASPRVLKPSEERVVHFLRKLDCEILVRSTGLLQSLRSAGHRPLTGDFSLNAANAVTVRALMDMGLQRLTPTHDCNAAQIEGLAHAAGADRLEVVAYHHLPVFHTEHCVFCRFLSTGTSYKDCGHPCEKHRVSLRDSNGRAHPVMADVGCRNTVFGAEAQEASAHIDGWMRVGIRHFRIEFVHEDPNRVSGVGEAFASYLDHRIGSDELARRLRRHAPQGTTEGSLFVPPNYMALPILQ